MTAFEIKINGPGRCSVAMDGVDISSRVRSISLHVEAGGFTEVGIAFLADSVAISADGMKDATSVADGWRRFEVAP